MRFRGMDRDSDGWITRGEWRGNDQSFSNHDWNGDGVLSGDEVRPGARRDRDDHRLDTYRDRDRVRGFRDLDQDNNGSISQNEWRRGNRSFNRLDSNTDGFLNSKEFSRRRKD
jgi:Ca2+-binding EF-hand superfamily protein